MARPDEYNWGNTKTADTDYFRTGGSPMSAALINNGYAAAEIPANQDHNTLFRNAYLWEQFLDDRADAGEDTLLSSSAEATWNGSVLTLGGNLDLTFRKAAGVQVNRIASGSLTFTNDGDVLVIFKDFTNASPVTLTSVAYGSLAVGKYAIVAGASLAGTQYENETILFRRNGSVLEIPIVGAVISSGQSFSFGNYIDTSKNNTWYGTNLFSSSAADPFRFHGSGDSFGGGKTILTISTDALAGGNFQFLKCVADYNGTPQTLFQMSDRGAIYCGAGTMSLSTISSVSTYGIIGTSDSATTGAIAVLGNATSDGICSELDFYNSSSASTDKRLGAVTASRSGANNTGIMALYVVNAGTAVKVFDASSTNIQFQSAIDVIIATGKKLYVDSGDNTYFTEASDDIVHLKLGTANNYVRFAEQTSTSLTAVNDAANGTAQIGVTNDVASWYWRIDGSDLDNLKLIYDSGSPSEKLEFSTTTLTSSINVEIISSNTNSNALYVEGNSLIASGRLAYFYSNSSNSGSRQLVQIYNDNSSATGTICLSIVQDAAQDSLEITQTGDGTAIAINMASVPGVNQFGLEIAGNRNTSSNTADIRLISSNSGAGTHSGIRFSGTYDYFFELPTDNTDPTGGGGAATGRFPVLIGGTLRYVPYY